jgi:hypothetical protein
LSVFVDFLCVRVTSYPQGKSMYILRLPVAGNTSFLNTDGGTNNALNVQETMGAGNFTFLPAVNLAFVVANPGAIHCYSVNLATQKILRNTAYDIAPTAGSRIVAIAGSDVRTGARVTLAPGPAEAVVLITCGVWGEFRFSAACPRNLA